jgi:hypothetical protein
VDFRSFLYEAVSIASIATVSVAARRAHVILSARTINLSGEVPTK